MWMHACEHISFTVAIPISTSEMHSWTLGCEDPCLLYQACTLEGHGKKGDGEGAQRGENESESERETER